MRHGGEDGRRVHKGLKRYTAPTAYGSVLVSQIRAWRYGVVPPCAPLVLSCGGVERALIVRVADRQAARVESWASARWRERGELIEQPTDPRRDVGRDIPERDDLVERNGDVFVPGREHEPHPDRAVAAGDLSDAELARRERAQEAVDRVKRLHRGRGVIDGR